MSTIKKIAFATTAEFSKNGQDIPEMYKKCILPFFQTAKKMYLPINKNMMLNLYY